LNSAARLFNRWADQLNSFFFHPDLSDIQALVARNIAGN
jgi:hypothetical protein